MIGASGRLILVGVPKIGQNINIFSLPLHFGKTIVGSFGGECQPSKDIPRFITLFQKEIALHKQLITSKISLENINSGIELMKSGKTSGRIIINF